MNELTSKAESLLDDFGHQPDVTPQHVDCLRAVLRDSTALTRQFNEAVEQGHLLKLVPLTHPNAGGEYNPHERSMHLPLSALAPETTYSRGEIIFILGHELQHGFNRAAMAGAAGRFETDVTQVARSPATVHDYTAAIEQKLAMSRRDEASAQIAGWNAVVSSLKTGVSDSTLDDVFEKIPHRMGDFIVKSDTPPYTYTLKPNLSLNPDMTMRPTVANVEAMGQNFFDKIAEESKLGYHGNSDYANYYAASAIGRAAELERHYNPPAPGIESPRMAVDMARLRLSEKLLEENGISLGRNQAPMPYIDLGRTPPSAHYLDHSRSTHAHVPVTSGMVARSEGSDFLDAYCAALQRDDRAACAALAEEHMQQAHMQALAQRGQALYEAQVQRQQQEEQQRQEQLRQEQLQREQAQQDEARMRGHAMSR